MECQPGDLLEYVDDA
ncbi:MAG: hypothetical protein LBU61_02180 [Coriobacteriales bacterium]|nr:hypothetical protein [Coriobacteriales bacterium]